MASIEFKLQKSNKVEHLRIREKLIKFCSTTTLHGFKYFTNESTETAHKKFQNRFWMAIVVVALIFCGYQLHGTVTGWISRPLIITINEVKQDSWKLPHPAVTICSPMKVDFAKFNFTKQVEMVMATDSTNSIKSEEDRNNFLAYLQTCSTDFIDKLGIVEEGVSDIDVPWHIKQMHRNLERKSRQFYYKRRTKIKGETGRLKDFCPYVVREIITEDGLCKTFNGLSLDEIYQEDVIKNYESSITALSESDADLESNLTHNLTWNPDQGFQPDDGLCTYPVRAEILRRPYRLQVMVTTRKENLNIPCLGGSTAVRVTVHSPHEFPQTSRFAMLLKGNSKSYLNVKPMTLTTDPDLREISSEIRQCFYHDERKLRFFKFYTQNNCELECLTNFTLKHCECVKFHMPRTKEMPICGLKSFECVADAEQQVAIFEAQNLGKDSVSRCNCLQACNSVTYKLEISRMAFNQNAGFETIFRNRVGYVFKETTSSSLVVAISSRTVYGIKRMKLSTITDLLSNCGGILSLFIGFSVFSVLEIFHLFSVQWIVLVKLFFMKIHDKFKQCTNRV